ncbi:MAG: ygjT [Myxococcales bacterium]|nr:ygjT [Myxococcales bacterium]
MSSLDVPAWAWALLAGLLLLFVTIDLIAHHGDQVDSRRRAVMWSVIWIGAALAFNGFVALHFGAEAGEQFLAAYLLEKSLSIDNLFLFLVIFGALRIPASEQHRVLTFGIIGALVTRCLFIVGGVAALHRWHEVTYAFGGLLVITALKLLRAPAETTEKPRTLDWLTRHLPWSHELDGHRFVTKHSGRWLATPMLIALIAIEITDVVFALDSIPAAFAVSNDTFILYSSNVFAILGLRALYVVLASALTGLRYLRFGLAGVLAFAGVKMLLASWVTLSPAISVCVIAVMIGVSVIASVIARRNERRRSELRV